MIHHLLLLLSRCRLFGGLLVGNHLVVRCFGRRLGRGCCLFVRRLGRSLGRVVLIVLHRIFVHRLCQLGELLRGPKRSPRLGGVACGAGGREDFLPDRRGSRT